MIKILLAESDEVARRAIRGALEHRGLFVECERDGTAAIRLGLVLEPEILIVGWRLADGTRGTDVAGALQRRIPGLRVVVVLPPDPEDGWESRCARIEVEAFLNRPLDFPRLLDVIDAI